MSEPALEQQTKNSASSARVRILVVDDSGASRAHILEALKRLPGTEADAVESGALALRAINQGGYSIILCDYEMPDMSGLQLLRFVRARHTALELPVLMLTSRDDSEVKLKAFRSGANDYVSKQAQVEELLARVSTQIELLEAHRRLDEMRLRTAEGQKFEAIGHLTEALAHELNTPSQYISDNLAFMRESFDSLRTILERLRDHSGSIEPAHVQELLAEADSDYLFGEIPRCIDESQQGIAQIARIVAVMREFARRGAQDVTAQDLNEIVRGAVAVTRGQMHQVADLELDLASDMQPVQCVGAAIKQVVLFAIMSAVKAMTPLDGMQRTRGRLTLRTAVLDEDWVSIELNDSGRSLGSEQISHVLDPVLGAVELDETAQGLAHARSVIVGDHGGKLDVTSGEQQGTRIVIRLQRRGERMSREFLMTRQPTPNPG